MFWLPNGHASSVVIESFDWRGIKHCYYFVVCCRLSASECHRFCSWWALLWGFRLWICCNLYGIFYPFSLIFDKVAFASNLLQMIYFILPKLPMCDCVGTGWIYLMCIPTCGCSCIQSCWSLDWLISLHDLACGSWNLEVILFMVIRKVISQQLIDHPMLQTTTRRQMLHQSKTLTSKATK